MPDEWTEPPGVVIQRALDERAGYSDEDVLTELAAFEVLPREEDGDAWATDAAWNRAYLLAALAEMVGARGLKTGVKLVIAATSFGDRGGTMSSLRHPLEAMPTLTAAELAAECEQASRSERSGARLWATRELGILRERSSFPDLAARLGDDERAIRAEAGRSLRMLCRVHADLTFEARGALRAAADAHPADGLAEELAALT